MVPQCEHRATAIKDLRRERVIQREAMRLIIMRKPKNTQAPSLPIAEAMIISSKVDPRM